jgi:hypothetical protein
VTEAFSVVPASLSLPLPPLSTIQRRKSLLLLGEGEREGKKLRKKEQKKGGEPKVVLKPDFSLSFLALAQLISSS